MIYCDTCKQHKPEHSFYYRKDRKSYHKNCKQCVSDRQHEIDTANKVKCIEYKGGCCQHCGYNKYHGALEFHHTDPTEKDFAIAEKSRAKWETVCRELDKCLLLCANCHREEHARLLGRLAQR